MIGVDRLPLIPLVIAATSAHNVCLSVQDICELQLENLALRQQLVVLRRSTPKRLKLTTADRIFWLGLRWDWAAQGVPFVLDVEDPSCSLE